MANDFKLGVDENGIEELLDVVPEELTNEALLELEWGRDQKQQKKPERRRRGDPSRKFTVKVLTEVIADLTKLLKKFKNMGPTPEGLH